MVVAAIIGGFLVFKEGQKAEKSAQESALKKVYLVADEHITALSRRRLQLAQKDAYGQILWDKWSDEKDYFADNVVKPRILSDLSENEKEALGKIYWQYFLYCYIDQKLDIEDKKNDTFAVFSDDMTPSEFETFCGEALKRAGWDARVTMQSHDQGSDVIAEKDGVRIVVQCKLYSKPVGNKAVQEVVAARAHEQADHGIVVSNNAYTAAAKALAQTNGVLLLHFRDLDSIDSYLGGYQSSPEFRSQSYREIRLRGED